METFSIRDLRDRSGELVRELESGHLAIITKHGKPVGVTVPISEHLVQSGVTTALAVELFRSHAVSLELAARIAGVSYIDFIDTLAQLRIPVVDYSPEELEGEIEVLESTDRR